MACVGRVSHNLSRRMRKPGFLVCMLQAGKSSPAPLTQLLHPKSEILHPNLVLGGLLVPVFFRRRLLQLTAAAPVISSHEGLEQAFLIIYVGIRID